MLSSWERSIEALGASRATTFPTLTSLNCANNLLDVPPRGDAEQDQTDHARSSDPRRDPERTDDRDRVAEPSDEALTHKSSSTLNEDRRRHVVVEDVRLHVIGLLSSFLESLEGTPITRVEREDAERFWIEKNAASTKSHRPWIEQRLGELQASESFPSACSLSFFLFLRACEILEYKATGSKRKGNTKCSAVASTGPL